MEAGDFEPTGPDLKEIQCTHCKHTASFEWEGKTVRCPAAGACLKFPKDNGGKPEGILFRIVNIKEHQNYDEGHYIKCPYFEEQ